MSQPEKWSITALKYSNLDELDESARELVLEADRATQLAYAPYSNFSVGAAIRLDDDAILTGCNQENESFPAGSCAERAVLYSIRTLKPGAKIKAIAVVARNEDKIWWNASPCGICRQSLMEFEKQQKTPIKVYMGMPGGAVMEVPSVGALLPWSFDL